MWNLNCYNKTRIYAHVLWNQNRKKEIPMDSTMHHMQEPQRARIKRTLDHMDKHDGNIKYDKYTGEIQYDSVKAPDSDVRQLLSILTSKKKRLTVPKGWDLFMRLLKDTDSPADIHLGSKWNKSVEKGDWGSLKDE